MRKRSFVCAAALVALLSGCATVNYTYKGKPCAVIEEDNEGVVLLCLTPNRDYGNRK